MKKRVLPLLTLSLLSAGALTSTGCSKLFLGYCDRVANGTAEKNWIMDAQTYSIPFSKAAYQSPDAGKPSAICVTTSGPTAEKAAGQNFNFVLSDSNDVVLLNRTGKALGGPQPVTTENSLKVWGGHETSQNKFVATECFPVKGIEPYVRVKVKNIATGETDESKIWSNNAYCQSRKLQK